MVDTQPHSTESQNNNNNNNNNSFVRTLLSLIPLLILLGGVALAIGVKVFSPQAERRPPPQGVAPTVEVLNIKPQSYQVVIESYGTVQPRTESTLVAQVSGLVTDISPSLRDGGFFEKNDKLLTIDSRDYEANVKIAEATLLDAQQKLAEEQAQSEQAKVNWERLGNAGPAPDLVLRKPQLGAAEARVISAKSSLDKARLDLERTVIRAPYAGRVLKKLLDVGQVVNSNTQIAEIYATDYVEVRLPLRDKDLAYVELPENYRYEDVQDQTTQAVTLSSSLVRDSTWEGRIVRTESAIDENARQLHSVAQIDDPFGELAQGRTPLKIGEYVTARIQGKLLQDAIVIPVSAIYQSTFTYVVEDGVLQQRTIEIAWQNTKSAIIYAGLQEGDQLVLTPMGPVTSGMKVRVHSDGNERHVQGSGTEAAPVDRKPRGASQ